MAQTKEMPNVLIALLLVFSAIGWAHSHNIDYFLTRGNHTNNWAVLVDTSRFWFNYRHVANVLSIYRTVKRLGIPDSQSKQPHSALI